MLMWCSILRHMKLILHVKDTLDIWHIEFFRGLQFKKHLVTTSYVSEAMQALDEKAKEAGVTLLCEMGLDPGIGIFPRDNLLYVFSDCCLLWENSIFLFHLLVFLKAVCWYQFFCPMYRSLDGHEDCGGLPAPEAASYPLGHEFRSAELNINKRHQLQRCCFEPVSETYDQFKPLWILWDIEKYMLLYRSRSLRYFQFHITSGIAQQLLHFAAGEKLFAAALPTGALQPLPPPTRSMFKQVSGSWCTGSCPKIMQNKKEKLTFGPDEKV